MLQLTGVLFEECALQDAGFAVWICHTLLPRGACLYGIQFQGEEFDLRNWLSCKRTEGISDSKSLVCFGMR